MQDERGEIVLHDLKNDAIRLVTEKESGVVPHRDFGSRVSAFFDWAEKICADAIADGAIDPIDGEEFKRSVEEGRVLVGRLVSGSGDMNEDLRLLADFLCAQYVERLAIYQVVEGCAMSPPAAESPRRSLRKVLLILFGGFPRARICLLPGDNTIYEDVCLRKEGEGQHVVSGITVAKGFVGVDGDCML